MIDESYPFDEASLPPAVQEYIRDSREQFHSLVRQRDAAEERIVELAVALFEAKTAIESVVADDAAIERGLFQGPFYQRILAYLSSVLDKCPRPTHEQLKKYMPGGGN